MGQRVLSVDLGMSEAIKLIVDGYVTLKDRIALEELRRSWEHERQAKSDDLPGGREASGNCNAITGHAVPNLHSVRTTRRCRLLRRPYGATSRRATAPTTQKPTAIDAP